jgi:GNAT superfamily N-acetyltransferase
MRADPMTADLQYRPATAGDALCLGVLATQVFLDTYAPEGIRPAVARLVLASCSVEAYAALLADPGVRLVVAERAGHLAGFAQLRTDAPHECLPGVRSAELDRLYVQEPFTGRGVGRRLLQEAERVACALGAQAVWLTAYVGNARALAFYPRQGYADVGATVFEFEGESHGNRIFAKSLAAEGAR